jgi:hypothetical protein
MELRTEITELGRRIEAVAAQHQREVGALKQMSESLKARAAEEFEAEAEIDRLSELDTKISALELEPAAGTQAKKPAGAATAGTAAKPH